MFCPFSHLSAIFLSFFLHSVFIFSPHLTWRHRTARDLKRFSSNSKTPPCSSSQWELHVWCLNSFCWEYLCTFTSSHLNTGRFHCDLLLMSLIWAHLHHCGCSQGRQIYQWLRASCGWCHGKLIRLQQDADPPHRPVNELSYSICLWSSTLSLAGSPLPFAGWESVCGVMVSGV